MKNLKEFFWRSCDFYIWSCLNLHGAENKSNTPKISLRYKIKSKNFKSEKFD